VINVRLLTLHTQHRRARNSADRRRHWRCR